MKKEVIEKLITIVTASFGLIAALAWNDTIKMIIHNFSETPTNILGMLIYSIGITLFAATMIVLLTRASSNK
ncbi:MAG: DUF5654 family protein [archaeon]